MSSLEVSNTDAALPLLPGIVEKLLEIVRRQTDYSDDIIIEKLKIHNNNVVDVVREYMNPTNSITLLTTKKIPPTTNQKIFGEIRKLMDDASEAYRKKKELAQK